MTNKYVIEGGLDKMVWTAFSRPFCFNIMGKEPAVAVYDTDGFWGKCEQRFGMCNK